MAKFIISLKNFVTFLRNCLKPEQEYFSWLYIHQQQRPLVRPLEELLEAH